MTDLERQPGYRWDEAQIHDGLTAVALWNGSTRKASEQLEKEGRPIPEATLRRWRDESQVETYARIREGVQDQIWRRTASRWHRVAEDAADGAREAISLTRQAMANPEGVSMAKDFSATAKNLAFAGGIANDKSAAADGRPTQITRDESADVLLKRLARQFGHVAPGVQHVDAEVEVVDDDAPALAASDTSRSA